MVLSCLRLADREGHTSIALPALGTGNLGYPAQDVARCMINAIIEYIGDNSSSTIRNVKIVIYTADRQTQSVSTKKNNQVSNHAIPSVMFVLNQRHYLDYLVSK